jgi:hypothetical protein
MATSFRRTPPAGDPMLVFAEVTMSLSEFAELLDEELSPDYWADDALHYAISLLPTLSDADWLALEKSWKAHTRRWQARFAETLGDAPAEHAVPILLDMLLLDDGKTVINAVESLRDIADRQRVPSLPAPVVERLQELARKRPFDADPINALLKRTNGS